MKPRRTTQIGDMGEVKRRKLNARVVKLKQEIVSLREDLQRAKRSVPIRDAVALHGLLHWVTSELLKHGRPRDDERIRQCQELAARRAVVAGLDACVRCENWKKFSVQHIVITR